MLPKSPPSSHKIIPFSLCHTRLFLDPSGWWNQSSSDSFKGGRIITVPRGSSHYSEGKTARTRGGVVGESQTPLPWTSAIVFPGKRALGDRSSRQPSHPKSAHVSASSWTCLCSRKSPCVSCRIQSLANGWGLGNLPIREEAIAYCWLGNGSWMDG